MPLHSLATVGKPKMAGEAEDTMLTGWLGTTSSNQLSQRQAGREPGGRDTTLTICGDCTRWRLLAGM